MAHRCFVQEDAGGAPILSTRPYSSPSRRPRNLPHRFMPISLPIHQGSVTSPPHVSKWFQLEPSVKCQMDYFQSHPNDSNSGFKSTKEDGNAHNASFNAEQIIMVERWASAVEEEVPYLIRTLEHSGITERDLGLSQCLSNSLEKFEGKMFFLSNPKTDSEKRNCYYSTKYDNAANGDTNVMMSSKQELLVALLRSQTRARRAEDAAQKVRKEKEHILNLLLTQTSHLFAHKLQLKLLQSEVLNFNRESQCSTISKLDSSDWESGTTLAMGLGLAAAGLLFGWTTGLLLSSS